MKVEQALKVEHTMFPKKYTIEAVSLMCYELGFKCVKTSYYLNDCLVSMQTAINRALTREKIKETDTIIIGTGGLTVKNKLIFEFKYGYQRRVAELMLNSKI